MHHCFTPSSPHFPNLGQLDGQQCNSARVHPYAAEVIKLDDDKTAKGRGRECDEQNRTPTLPSIRTVWVTVVPAHTQVAMVFAPRRPPPKGPSSYIRLAGFRRRPRRAGGHGSSPPDGEGWGSLRRPRCSTPPMMTMTMMSLPPPPPPSVVASSNTKNQHLRKKKYGTK
jgi:hypothetical protein